MTQAIQSPTLFSEAAKERVPGAPPPIPPTPLPACDRAVDELAANAAAWTKVGLEERAQLLERCMDLLLGCAEGWVEAACREKGIPHDQSIGGQEWVGGPMNVMRCLRQHVAALRCNGAPRPSRLERRGPRWVARVIPDGVFEKLAYGGLTAEVWIQPGHEPSQGKLYREKRPHEGGVSLVLGAGNQASIGPGDVVAKLMVDDEVVLLKMNPVNEHTGPFLEKTFAPFVERGFLRVVYGGAEQGRHITQNPKLASIHITGSARTHDAIVWGGDPAQQAERKRKNTPVFTKPITSELGCVSPCIVVPGSWSEKNLDFQARHVASMVTYNAGFTCTSTQALVLSADWPQKTLFLEKVAAALARHPPRPAYYPGASMRKKGFQEHYPQGKALGASAPASLPYLLLPVSADGEDYALREEAFCGVLAHVEIPGATADAFLENAARFANDRVWGTLSCTMLIDPATASAHAAALEKALETLRYGTIGVNVWGGVGFGLVTTPWGAFPGHTLDDVMSGIGFVHNTYMFDYPEKSVLRAPFHMSPPPAWFTDHRNLHNVGRAGTKFERRPGLGSFIPVVLAGLKG